MIESNVQKMCHGVQAQGGGMPFAQPMGFGQGGFFGQGMFPGPGRQGPVGQPAAERPKEVIIPLYCYLACKAWRLQC